MRLGRVIGPGQSSREACKAVASSSAGGKLVAIVGSFLGTFDAAFVKQIAAIIASSIIAIVVSSGLVVIIDWPQLSGRQTGLALFVHVAPYSRLLAFYPLVPITYFGFQMELKIYLKKCVNDGLLLPADIQVLETQEAADLKASVAELKYDIAQKKETEAKSKYENGILTITIPKLAAAKSVSIKVD